MLGPGQPVELGGAQRGRLPAQVGHADVRSPRPVHDLDGRPVPDRVGGAQHLVPADHLGQGGQQRPVVERAGEPPEQPHVPARVGMLQLARGHPLLLVRLRRHRDGAARSGRTGAGARAVRSDVRQTGQARRLRRGGRRDADPYSNTSPRLTHRSNGQLGRTGAGRYSPVRRRSARAGCRRARCGGRTRRPASARSSGRCSRCRRPGRARRARGSARRWPASPAPRPPSTPRPSTRRRRCPTPARRRCSRPRPIPASPSGRAPRRRTPVPSRSGGGPGRAATAPTAGPTGWPAAPGRGSSQLASSALRWKASQPSRMLRSSPSVGSGTRGSAVMPKEDGTEPGGQLGSGSPPATVRRRCGRAWSAGRNASPARCPRRTRAGSGPARRSPRPPR